MDQLVDLIASRPKREGFSQKQLDGLRRQLDGREHRGKFRPVTLDLWYGSLAATRKASISWFTGVCRELSLSPYDYLSATELDFYSGSEYSGVRRLSACRLDLMAHYDSEHGIVPDRIRRPEVRQPGFVVLQTLCLHPQLILKLGTDEFPPYGLMMPGLVADSDNVPHVYRGRRDAIVNYHWAGNTWDGTSLPAFEEL